MNAIPLALGWAFVIIMGLIVAWVFVRYILPWLLMLALISGCMYVGFEVYEAHQRDVVARGVAATAKLASQAEHIARSEAERAVKSLSPKLAPATKKARKKVTTQPAFCVDNPWVAACHPDEERD